MTTTPPAAPVIGVRQVRQALNAAGVTLPVTAVEAGADYRYLALGEGPTKVALTWYPRTGYRGAPAWAFEVETPGRDVADVADTAAELVGAMVRELTLTPA